jgi:hypothetical protein
MPSIRLLDLTNLVALSPAKHFFNGLLEDRQWVRYRSFFRSANCADSRRMLTNEGNLLKRTSGTNGDVKPLLAW